MFGLFKEIAIFIFNSSVVINDECSYGSKWHYRWWCDKEVNSDWSALLKNCIMVVGGNYLSFVRSSGRCGLVIPLCYEGNGGWKKCHQWAGWCHWCWGWLGWDVGWCGRFWLCWRGEEMLSDLFDYGELFIIGVRCGLVDAVLEVFCHWDNAVSRGYRWPGWLCGGWMHQSPSWLLHSIVSDGVWVPHMHSVAWYVGMDKAFCAVGCLCVDEKL